MTYATEPGITFRTRLKNYAQTQRVFKVGSFDQFWNLWVDSVRQDKIWPISKTLYNIRLFEDKRPGFHVALIVRAELGFVFCNSANTPVSIEYAGLEWYCDARGFYQSVHYAHTSKGYASIEEWLLGFRDIPLVRDIRDHSPSWTKHIFMTNQDEGPLSLPFQHILKL